LLSDDMLFSSSTLGWRRTSDKHVRFWGDAASWRNGEARVFFVNW
jgi:hypothetical protein